MLAKPIEYEDYNGKVQTEVFYFNLNPTELRDLQYSKEEGFEEYFKKVQDDKNIPEMFRTIEDLILRAYGIKSEDGRRFEKSDELFMAFKQSMAYQELFMELVSVPEQAKQFFMGLLPVSIQRQIEADANVSYTIDDLVAMDQSQFDKIAGTDMKHMSRDHLMAAYQRRMTGQVA